MISRDTATKIPTARRLGRPGSLEATVRRFHQVLPAFNDRRLAWDDVVGLANQLGAPIVLERSRIDACLSRRFGGSRIVVDSRLNQESWAIFCVLHELVHLVAHPGPREFYMGSPGWYSHTETQANTVALLALSPQPKGPPYPRILQAEPQDSLISLLVAYVTERGSTGEFGPRWVSRKVTLQRHP